MFSAVGVVGMAQIISLALTFLFVINDIHSSANNQVSLRACAIWPSLAFFLTFAVGNAVATLLVPLMAPEIIVREWTEELNDFSLALTYALAGVLGFEGIISNLTYSTSGADYSLRERVTRARDLAVERALDKEIQLENQRQRRKARKIKEVLTEPEINAHILEILGSGIVNDLETQADNEQAPTTNVKCNTLAALKPSDADAILKEARRERGWIWRLRHLR